MKKIFLYLSIAFSGFLLFAGTNLWSAEKPVYKLSVSAWAGCVPAYVAKEKNFWDGNDFTVALADLGDEINIDTLKKGVFDIAFDMIGTAVGNYLDGNPIVIMAETNWSHGGDKIIMQKGTQLDQIKNKTIGVYQKLPAVTFFLNQLLQHNNMKLSDFRLIEMEPEMLTKMFVADKLQLIVNYDPDALTAEREGNGEAIATTATYPGCMPEGMFMLKNRYDAIPKAHRVQLVKGIVRAAEWINDPTNWSELKTILETQVFKDEGPLTEDDLKEMMDAVIIHNPTQFLERNKNGGGLQTYLQDLNQFLKDNKLSKKEFSPTDLFDNESVLEALQDS